MLTVTFVLITVLIVYLIFTTHILDLVLREDGSLDERDLAILRGSYTGEHLQPPVAPSFFGRISI
jgi:riboflavin synthase